MIINSTRALAAAAAVLALAGTAACGTVGGKAADGATHLPSGPASAPASSGSAQGLDVTPAALLIKASDKTGAAKSARIQETITAPTGQQVTEDGEISWANGLLGTMQVQLPAAISGKLGTDGKADAQILSDAMYVNMHLSGAMLSQLGGKHWIRYPYADLAKAMGASGNSIKDGFKNADPVAAVRMAIASGKITKVGTDTVNGAPATHYSGDLTLDDLAGGNKLLEQGQIQALRQQLTAAGVTSDHIEVWVNGDNLLVKKVEQADSKNGRVDVTVLYSDYGVQVQTDPPAASDTIDLSELTGQSKQPAIN